MRAEGRPVLVGSNLRRWHFPAHNRPAARLFHALLSQIMIQTRLDWDPDSISATSPWKGTPTPKAASRTPINKQLNARTQRGKWSKVHKALALDNGSFGITHSSSRIAVRISEASEGALAVFDCSKEHSCRRGSLASSLSPHDFLFSHP